MDFSTLLRIILLCAGIGLFGGLLALIISLIFRKASRLLALIPGLLLLVLAIASAIKAAFFNTQAWDDLGFAVLAILLGGAAIVAILCGLIIILVRKRKSR